MTVNHSTCSTYSQTRFALTDPAKLCSCTLSEKIGYIQRNKLLTSHSTVIVELVSLRFLKATNKDAVSVTTIRSLSDKVLARLIVIQLSIVFIRKCVQRTAFLYKIFIHIDYFEIHRE